MEIIKKLLNFVRWRLTVCGVADITTCQSYPTIKRSALSAEERVVHYDVRDACCPIEHTHPGASRGSSQQ